MATMNKVVEYVDRVKPNAYSDDDKFRWINTLEGTVSLRILGREEPMAYELPRDADKELLVAHPFDDIYALYVCAMIDYHNREYNSYNNTVLLLQRRMDEYRAWYVRRYACPDREGYRNVMG